MLLASTVITTLLWFANLCLVAVFTLAAVAKLRDRERARASLLGFGVAERWAQPALVALVSVDCSLRRSWPTRQRTMSARGVRWAY